MSSSTSLNLKAWVMFKKALVNKLAIGVLFGKLSKHITSNHKLWNVRAVWYVFMYDMFSTKPHTNTALCTFLEHIPQNIFHQLENEIR